MDTTKLTELEKVMHDLTSGGYQIFNPSTMPVTPHPESICYGKLASLMWKKEDFENKVVADLGCSLGFFSYYLLGLDVKHVVGYDVQAQSIRFANEIKKVYCTQFPEAAGRIDFIEKDLLSLPAIPKVDIIVCNSLIHWFIAKGRTLEECLIWLRDSCKEAVFFEGCFDSREEIMKKLGVSEEKLNPKLFNSLCKKMFTRVVPVSIPVYNPMRVVLRLYR